jgi:ABC-type transporter Mla MlaB component
MVTKASPPGLLAKMAQLVRSGSSSPEAPDSDLSRHSEFDKVDLQARITAKRRDDLVRRREFNHLRQIRAMSGLGGAGLAVPSVFQSSSSFSPDERTPQDRAHTVKKINAIEAHMGEHWKLRKRSSSPPPEQVAPVKLPASRHMELPVLTETFSKERRPAPSAVVPEQPPAAARGDSEMDLDFTGMLSGQAPLEWESQPVTIPYPTAAEPDVDGASSSPNDNSAFGDSRLESEELGQGSDNPALQDAAIRFAEGDVAGAEAALLAVVQDPGADVDGADACACALLDMYRATDQGASFDVVAIEYAQRFGRSAPEWYSIPALLHSTAPAHVEVPAAVAAAWMSPPVMDTVAVTRLGASQPGSQKRQYQWEQLESIAPQAVADLARQFTQWAELPIALEFSGVDVLNAVLQASTVTGQRDTDPLWWHLRLEALRIQGAHETFDEVALDYCITYDVSPPSWLEADCTFSQALDHETEEQSAFLETVPPGFVDTRSPDSLELRGELLGDASAVLARLQARAHVGEPIVIHCQRLIRIDFSAAGSMLNWLTTQQAKGVAVDFVQVPRLVGAFMQVMGIADLARVVVSIK